MMLLVDWRNFFINIFVGVVSGFFVVTKIFQHSVEFDISFNDANLIVYQIVFGTIVALLFARRKQLATKSLMRENNFVQLLRTYSDAQLLYEKNASSRLVKHLGSGDVDIIKKLQESKLKIQENNKIASLNCINDIELYLKTVIHHAKDHLRLNVDKIEIEKFMNDIEDFFISAFGDKVSVILRSHSKSINCDLLGIYKVVSKAIETLQMKLAMDGRKEDVSISVYVSDAKLTYFLKSIPGYNREIDSFNIVISTREEIKSSLLDKHYTKELINPEYIQPTELRQLDSVAISRILEAHYGFCEDLSTDVDLTYVYVLPQNVYDIRPKPMDLEIPEKVVQFWPEAIKIEKKFMKELEEKAPQVILADVEKTLVVIRKYHAHQLRKSNEPYYLHPVEVARIVLDMIDYKSSNVYKLLQENQRSVVIAALLHDVLEDTAMHPVFLQTEFGSEVTNIILGVTKIDYEERSRMLTNNHAFGKLIAQDPLVVCIKLADRLHNIMTIDGHLDEEKRRSVAKETLDFFIKPAQELGFDYIVEDLGAACKHIIEKGRLGDFKFKG